MKQGELDFKDPPGWGGKRKGAGRPRSPKGKRHVSHLPRPAFKGHRDPVAIGLKADRSIGNLRSPKLFAAIRQCLSLARERFGTRIVHFSVLGDHVHLLVEAVDGRALSRATQGLAIRLAKAINRALGRTGKVWIDRFYSRALRSPTEVRNALLYTLNNFRKHLPPGTIMAPDWIDPCSSAPWFDGWRDRATPWPSELPPTAQPETWLLREGWRRAGPEFRTSASPARR